MPMPPLKDRSESVEMMVVGRPPADRLVEVCNVVDCKEPSTQMHGLWESPIYTCDQHAEAVMLALAETLL